jgi:curli biogenesis system outer membrane secretion channel CsgG
MYRFELRPVVGDAALKKILFRSSMKKSLVFRSRELNGNHPNGAFLMKKYLLVVFSAAALLGMSGCASESSKALPVAQVASAGQAYSGPRTPIAVGKFDNRSSYMRGIFSDGVDRLGGQAKTILMTHLQQTNRFTVLDRDNMAELEREAAISKTTQQLKGADFVITGDVTEFGRKETGDQQLFGILGRGKQQVAYAKVMLNVVNIKTSAVVYSVGGAGEYQLSNREVIGFGGTASYDSTLNGKVLDLAVREAVNGLVSAIDSGAWRPSAQ